jgi:hypothetical protein
MEKIYSGREIPGMIEPIEQALLETLAKEISFENEESVVEFGTFFGRSTACIAAGLQVNKTFSKNSKFYAYDSFECDLSGSFYSHVLSFAKGSNCENLLNENGTKVNFYPIFQRYLDHYIKNEILFPQKEELVNSFPENRAIRLMHIDSPKFYDEFKFILYRFFPYLKQGGFVVFQDFFYHWSASLIAVIGIMYKNGFLTFEKSAASSLLCKVSKTFNSTQINEIDLVMSDKNIIPQSIDFLIETMKMVDLDRRDIFLPRLKLAKIQWLYEDGNHITAAGEVAKFANEGNKFNSAIANDFLELMRFGFSIRRLYSKDHS